MSYEHLCLWPTQLEAFRATSVPSLSQAALSLQYGFAKLSTSGRSCWGAGMAPPAASLQQEPNHQAYSWHTGAP